MEKQIVCIRRKPTFLKVNVKCDGLSTTLFYVFNIIVKVNFFGFFYHFSVFNAASSAAFRLQYIRCVRGCRNRLKPITTLANKITDAPVTQLVSSNH